MKVPFLDLVTPHRELEDELTAAFRAALQNAAFVGGPKVEGFEREFAEFCGTEHAVGVNSGTDALRFAIMAVGLQSGDTVLTVPNTFIATSEAITQAGGRVDFVDVDPATYTMDPRKLRSYLETECRRDAKSGRAVSRRTGTPVAAVIPVHLYGQMADMDPILEIAGEHGLIVIEDACQAHGARYFSRRENRWRLAGSMGRAAAFSFYPGKNLGACGEAGAVTTDDEQVAKICRMLREHGQSRKYFHDIEGYNGRLDAVQAALLSIKLRHLATWNIQRLEAAKRYDRLLGAVGISAPHVPTWSEPVYHLYVVRVQARASVQQTLGDAGIATGIHYPFPLHLLPAYEGLGFRRGDLPVSELAANEVLSLPMFPNLSAESQQAVVNELVRCTTGAAAALR